MMDESIRVRACLAVVEAGKLLLVPHYQTEAGDVQWNLPGGKVEFCEALEAAALREFHEETGYEAEIVRLLATSEVLLPERPYHSITIAFLGKLIGGTLQAEADHGYGRKIPQWFSAEELCQVAYHPPSIVDSALGITANTDASGR